MEIPHLGFGVGLRTPHYNHILKHWPKVDWFEVISENYMVEGGRPLYFLDQIRERYPVVPHGVSLSVGSTDPLNPEYLKKLKKLIRRVDAPWFSDHLCWTGVHGKNAHDLLPLPYTLEAANQVITKIKQVQNEMECPFLLENVSSYMEYTASSMSEGEFLNYIVIEADCGILLDINNIFVSSKNHEFDPLNYLSLIPADRVGQFHLAGHSNKGTHLLDTHDHPVRKAVWDLYRHALEKFGPISTLLERDDRMPPFPTLEKELGRAKNIYHEVKNSSHKTSQPQRNPKSFVALNYSP